jgi:hypothetical protein
MADIGLAPVHATTPFSTSGDVMQPARIDARRDNFHASAGSGTVYGYRFADRRPNDVQGDP